VLHPAFVHIPIGAFFACCVLTAVAWYRRTPQLEYTGYVLVVFSWVALIPATLTGTYDAVVRLQQPALPADALFWINLHAASAITLWISLWLAWQQRRRITVPEVFDAPRFRPYVLRLVIGFVCLILSGWSGGHMVYTLRFGILP
jgi:uncharacterized membrane protein